MRNVCFTVYKFKAPEFMKELPKGVRYIVWQLEKCPKSGKHHLQGYMELHKSKEFKPIQKILDDPTAHLEARKAKTAKEAVAYCKKADSRVEGPWELGTCSQQGSRVDLEGFRDAIKEKKTNAELLDTHLGQMARYPRLLGLVRETMRPPDTPELCVTLFLGKTDTGKSRAARAYFDGKGMEWWTPPIQQGMSHWFDQYCWHPGVILDEFNGSMPLTDLLKVLDIYPLYVPIKGGHTWYRPKEIIITSNYHPLKWYDWLNPRDRTESIEPLRRRIHRIWDFNAPPSRGARPDITDMGWNTDFVFATHH